MHTTMKLALLAGMLATAPIAASAQDAPAATTGTFAAVITGGGNISRATPGTTANPLGAGNYEVLFPSSVRKCAYVATRGLVGSTGVAEPGFVTVASRNGNVKGVFIQVFDKDGNLDTGGFHLVVHCFGA